MKLTTKRLKQIIKEVLSESAPAISTKPTPEEAEVIHEKMDKLMQAALAGDQGAIQMLMDYE